VDPSADGRDPVQEFSTQQALDYLERSPAARAARASVD
jgi:hypothetical protein